MQFTPKPENDFEKFIHLYYNECRAKVPRIAAIAGKWSFEDLIPGLSDFDTRFIVEDGMTVDDWCHMSTSVGEVHLDLCKRFPHWARNLEHLPGINLTWMELTDPATYYAEYPQWTYYLSAEPDRLRQAEAYLADRSWGIEDEYFHLKKFCLYCGRYSRTIDPPVNLGAFESKYPLHSRFMHYFCPPLQSALCILLKRPVRGKMETVRLACDMFDDRVFREMRDVIERHYEVPELYEEPEVSYLEDRLEAALAMLRDRLGEALTVVPDAPSKDVAEWKAELDSVPINPFLRVSESARFSRLMKGRLQFYAASPPHFDSVWCIENELRRLRTNFFEIPFGIFWHVTTGERVASPIHIVPTLAHDLLTLGEVWCVQEFVRLLPGDWKDGEQQKIATALAEIFDGFYSALNKIMVKTREASEERAR